MSSSINEVSQATIRLSRKWTPEEIRGLVDQEQGLLDPPYL